MTSIDSVSAQNISHACVQNADGCGATAQAAKQQQQQSEPSPTTDAVSLSDSAKSFAAARDTVQSAPDVRDQKIADIKQQISDGTYSVSSRELARKMLSDQQCQT